MNCKIIILATVAGILTIAGLPAITAMLYRLEVIPIAQLIRTEYLTGTTLAVILALLILLPSTYGLSVARRVDRCPVCEHRLRLRGRYCPACGSRVAA